MVSPVHVYGFLAILILGMHGAVRGEPFVLVFSLLSAAMAYISEYARMLFYESYQRSQEPTEDTAREFLVGEPINQTIYYWINWLALGSSAVLWALGLLAAMSRMMIF